jgi:hypothetical protein
LIPLFACQSGHQQSDLLGTWDFINSIDKETKEVLVSNNDETFTVEFRKDSLFFPLTMVDSFFILENHFLWKMNGDTIIIEELGSAYIKELTRNTLVVDTDIEDGVRLTFKKIK